MTSPHPPPDPTSSSSGVDRSAITRLLRRWSEGEPEAAGRLMEIIYGDLKAIAHGRLRAERSGHTLRTTALVHEAYLRLVETRDTDWRDRAHFFAVASRVIRHVLVDYARSRKAQKRGGDRVRVTLAPETARVEEPVLEVLALDEALSGLADRSPRLAQVVECRFFAGMSVRETAVALEVSTRTVERDWRKARAYLYRDLASGDPEQE